MSALSLGVLSLGVLGGSIALGKCEEAREIPRAGEGWAGAGELAEPDAEPQRPAAIVDGTVVTWDELRASLSEAAGGEVLRERVLDARLAAAARDRGIIITDDDVRRERTTLAATAVASGASADEAALGLEAVRKARGLGEQRFTALLRRTATLRALVRDRVTVTDAMVQQAFEVRYGPRVRVRVIVVADVAKAEALRRELADASGVCAAMRFAEAAALQSSDSSAPAGGLIEPLSVLDPRYPAALRGEARTLQIGHVSGPVALEKGAALVYMDAKLPALEVKLADVRAELEGQLRQGLERAAMDDAARDLLRSVPMTIMDRSLQWSWDASGGASPSRAR